MLILQEILWIPCFNPITSYQKNKKPGAGQRTLHWAYFFGEIPTALVKALKKLL